MPKTKKAPTETQPTVADFTRLLQSVLEARQVNPDDYTRRVRVLAGKAFNLGSLVRPGWIKKPTKRVRLGDLPEPRRKNWEQVKDDQGQPKYGPDTIIETNDSRFDPDFATQDTPDARLCHLIQSAQAALCRLTGAVPLRGDEADIILAAVKGLDPQPDRSGGPTTSDLSMLSCGDLAKIHGLDAKGKNALEQRLRAWRFDNAQGWIEPPNPTKNSPRFLYLYRAVKHLAEAVSASQPRQSGRKSTG